MTPFAPSMGSALGSRSGSLMTRDEEKEGEKCCKLQGRANTTDLGHHVHVHFRVGDPMRN